MYIVSLMVKGSMCKSLVKEIASNQFISWWEMCKENGHGGEEICWSINKHVFLLQHYDVVMVMSILKVG